MGELFPLIIFMISRNGIYYDLTNSHYRVKINGITYVFSSKLHKDKFIKRLEKNRKEINESLSNRFNIKLEIDILADLVLYTRIEKRGFLILNDKGEILCNTIKFDGEITTKKNSAE